MNGLMLTAGGARGAYQAGVLKRVGELPRLKNQKSPFEIVAGASAGALNVTMLAAHAEDFTLGVKKMAEAWETIRFKDVFRTDLISLGRISGLFLLDFIFGGVIGGGRAQSLLDARPLRKFLKRQVEYDRIARNIENGNLYALAVTATNYFNGKSYTFVQGKPGHPMWKKSRREAVATEITVDHIWASAAIPVVFQPVKLTLPQGQYYFGDGGLRLVTPFSPAIRLGAEKVFAIGIRSQQAAEQRMRSELLHADHSGVRMRPPPLAQVFGVALNSMFLDHLETDYDHLTRINELIKSFGNMAEQMKLEMHEPMRPIQALVIQPSVDLAKLAEPHSKRLPAFVGYLMEGLGASVAQSADLKSYMLFDERYTRELVEIGYRDASDRIEEIESFLFG